MRKIRSYVTVCSLVVFLLVAFSFVPQVQADITTGLVGYWAFDEGSGTTINDSTANDRDGSTVASPSWVSGKFGNALYFDGANTTGQAVSIPSIPVSNTFSWSVWAKHDSVNGDADDQYIVSLGGCLLFWKGYAANNLLQLGLGNVSDSTLDPVWDAPGASSVWTHIVVTSDEVGNISKLYLNNVEQDSAMYQDCDLYGSPLTLTVGEHPDYFNSRDWNGALDDVRLYSRALSPSDVTELYNYSISAPTVTTSATVNSISQTSATLNGSIDATGGLNATEHGFAYGTVANLSSVIATTTGGAFSGTGSFTSSSARNISSLTCGTTYYYRAYATNGSAGFGIIRSFDTSACNTVPDAPTSVTATSSNASARVLFVPPINDGGQSIDYYAVTSSPGGIVKYGASSPITITGLTNGTQYTFSVVAHNSTGTSTASSASNYVTPSATPHTLPTVILLAPTVQGQTNMTLNERVTALGGEAPFARGFQYGTATTTYGATSTASGAFAIGSYSSSISSLSCGTRYYYRAYATNSAGVDYSDPADFVTSGCHEYFVSPTGTAGGDGSIGDPWDLQTALSGAGGDIVAGDTIWLRGGTYSPGVATTSQWTVSFAGSLTKPIVWRSYTGEWAKIDKKWRFSANSYHYFRDLEFYDSDKGHHVISGYPNGPWLHFDANNPDADYQWVNVVVHDVPNAWSGGTCQRVRGSIGWYMGLTGYDHVCYPSGESFIGNIIGWHLSEVMNLTVATSTFNSNIVFGSGQIVRGSQSGDILANGFPLTLIGNYFYNRYSTNILSEAIQVNNSPEGAPSVITDNIIVAAPPVRFTGSGTDSFGRVEFLRNIVHMSLPFGAYPVLHRYSQLGEWYMDYNSYSTDPGQPVVFEDEGVGRFNFSDWKTQTGLELNSTSVDGAYPPDSVNVVIDVDTPKRAHIAVYNWTQASTVTADISNVLDSGDTYSLYSAQNFLAGPIQTGTVSGTTISVPMTGLTVAPILSGSDWPGFANFPGSGLFDPPLTSPEFGAFVVIGAAPLVSVPSLSTGDSFSVTDTTVTLGGSIGSTGNANPTIRGFVYGLTTSYGSNTSTSGSFSTGSFTASISSLTCGTVYHYAAYAENTAGTGYGLDDTFTTSDCTTPAPAAPSGGGGSRGGGGGGGTTAPVATTTATTTCTTIVYPTLLTNLALNSQGTEVTTLKKILTAERLLATSTTAVYDLLTQTAVQQFQVKYNIATPTTPGYGKVGPKTRTFINARIQQRLYPTLGVCLTLVAPRIATSTPYTFTRTLTLGSTGPDVKVLQIYLNTHGFPISSTGIGSPGRESTYFGPATKAALVRFQVSKGITPASGVMGPKTRGVVNQI